MAVCLARSSTATTVDDIYPSRDQLEVDEQWREGAVTFTLRGDLDHVGAQGLDRMLTEATAKGAASITIDLSNVRLLDSSGMRSLLVIALAAEGGGPPVRLLPAPPAIQSRFVVTGLQDRLPFVSPKS